LLKPDGNGKLSKRDGDRLGFPVFPLQWKDPNTAEVSSGYREAGYFPEAFVNMLALLGWNPGTDQEIFSLEELVHEFSLERVGKSGSKFDPEKAKWFNHQYLQSKSIEEISQALDSQLMQQGIQADTSKIEAIAQLMRQRANFIDELREQSMFFFKAPETYDPSFAKKRWKEETPAILKEVSGMLKELDPFDAQTIDAALHNYMEKSGHGAGKIMPGLRLALVGSGTGPDVKEIMAVIGKEETISRIEMAVLTIKS
jgi:glutamyl-tRNA synthetase